MPKIEIKKVETRRDLKKFIEFHYDLYEGNEYDVPTLFSDDMSTLDREKNAAFEFCEAEYYLAYKDGRLAGRVAAIVNHRANETWQRKSVRFGWIDFIDDLDVSRALLDAVADFGRRKGMKEVIGPLGFTDFDPEGMLTSGFDELGTMATIYNYPYYPQHLLGLGFEKETGWVERKVFFPKGEHEANNTKYFRIARMTEERYGFRLRHFRSKSEIRKGGYVETMLGVINKAYADLYGYNELDDQQMQWYAKRFLQMLDRNYISVVETQEGEIIGVSVCMPSLSRAVQKAKAKLFPFGWWHVVRELFLKQRHQILDMLLIGVLPEYQDKGANALFFADMIPFGINHGFEWAETHPQLEDNLAGQMQWKNLDCSIHKRRAVFCKKLS